MKIKYLILALFFITVAACVPKESATCHKYLYIKNNSNTDIYWVQASAYPSDTVLGRSYSYRDKISKFQISDRYSVFKDRCIEAELPHYPEQKLYLTLLDAAVVESTPWDTICKKDMVLKRYKLSVADLMRMDFTVTYP